MAASSQYIGNSSTVEFCRPGNDGCRPVTSGDLFAAISLFTLWPWVIVMAVVGYFAFADGDGCSLARCSRTAAPGIPNVPGPGDAGAAGGAASASNPRARSRPKSRNSGSESDAGNSNERRASETAAAGAARHVLGIAAARTVSTGAGFAKPAVAGSAKTLESVVRPIAGSTELLDGTCVRATSRNPTIGLRIPIAATQSVRFEVEVLTAPSGPLVVGIVNGLVALDEARQSVGVRTFSWGFDLAAGTTLSQTEIDGRDPVPAFAAATARAGDVYSVQVHRAAGIMRLVRGPDELAMVDLGDCAAVRSMLVAITIPGGAVVRLRLGNGWGAVKHIGSGCGDTLGSLLDKGDQPGEDLVDDA